MKKLIGILFVLCLAFALAACGNGQQEPAGAEEFEPRRTAEEYGEIIVAGEGLRYDLLFPGPWQHVDASHQRQEGDTLFLRVLPSLGLHTVDEVMAALSQYFTEEMLENLGPGSYEEHGGYLYFLPYIASGGHFFWDAAEFSILERDESRSVVEARVMSNDEGIPARQTFYYTLVGGRIAAREHGDWEPISWDDLPGAEYTPTPELDQEQINALALQIAGTWQNALRETLTLPAEIPENERWYIRETANGAFEITMQLLPAEVYGHDTIWVFPIGVEMLRDTTYGTIVPSDLSRPRIYFGSFSLTTCCPDEVVNREVYFLLEDNASEGDWVGVILGDVVFQDIAVSRLFIEPFVDVLGDPQVQAWPADIYEGIEIMGDRGDLVGLPNMAILLWAWGRDLHLFALNGISLDMTRPEIIDAFGPLTDYPAEGSLTFYISNPVTEYMLTFHFEDLDDSSLVTSISMGRMDCQVR